MIWFKKKKKEETQPDIPTLSDLNLPPISSPDFKETLPKLPETEETKFQLPSDDKKESEEGLIKKAITDTPSLSNNLTKAEPFDSKEFGEIETPRTLEIEEPPKKVKKIEPIYIRLDKFEASVEAFEEIKEKITEIEKLLIKIKEIRNEEEKELSEWENELQIIKARIDSIDREIFGKLD